MQYLRRYFIVCSSLKPTNLFQSTGSFEPVILNKLVGFDHTLSVQEIIDLFKAKDEVKIKARIQNQIDALSLLNYDDD